MSQQEFSFVHAADLHLDTAFEGLRRIDPAVASRLRDASLAALEKLVDFTLSSKASFLLLAGDIYDGAEHGVRAELYFLRAVERLTKAGVRVFIAHGNHDPLSGWSTIKSWPSGVHLFSSREAEQCTVTNEHGTLASIYGISYERRAEYENLVKRFPRVSRGAHLNIGMVHATVTGTASPDSPDSKNAHEPYSPCSLEDLRETGMDYWALGHIHIHSRLSDKGSWIVYPGTLQGRSLKPSECGEKGAVSVRAKGNEIREVSFVALDAVRFIRLEADLSPCSDLGDAARAVLTEVEKAVTKHAGADLVIRVTLSGRSTLYRHFSTPQASDELCLFLREELRQRSPLVWCERVQSSVRPVVNLEEVRARNDFPAELVVAAERVRSEDRGSAPEGSLESAARDAVSRWLPGESAAAGQASELDDALLLALELLEAEGAR